MTNRRPLVMRCGAFGDMVLLTALLRQLHTRCGQPVDVISSGSWTLPLLEGQPGVGEIFLIRSRKTPFWLSPGQQALVRWLRKRAAGPTWFCDPGVVGRALLRRGQVPDAYVCEDRAFPQIPGEHFVDRWIRFAQMTPPAFAGRLAAAAPPVSRAAVLQVSAESHAALARWLQMRGLDGRALILVQPGNKRTMRGLSRRRRTNTKYWPEPRWAAVVRALREERPDHAILLLGVPAEYALNAQIAQLAGVSDLHNVADDLPIRILLPLFERAGSLVSVDTGPAHAAAALGCPTVALFGTSDPRVYRPGGIDTPAITLTGERDGQPSMLGIEVDSVVRAWRAVSLMRVTDRPRAAPLPAHC